MTEPTAMPVRTGLQDRAFVITIDNPPVNVLGQAVRAALLDACDQAAKALGGGEADRVIVTGAGRAFVAGADTREFDGPALDPQLPDVLARLSALPAIAAINGAALGGGFEIALACRARIATPHALVGLPEVTLGVVPGAGGTQRLPRLIGVEAALPLISTGRLVKGAEAARLGLVDALSDDPLAAALALDAALLARLALDDLPCPAPAPDAGEAARLHARKRLRAQVAPLKAIELVEAAARLPLAEGLAQERAAFLELRASPQARALRHVFFAERSAGAAPAVARLTPAPLKTALVAGGGTMGAAIAYALQGAGLEIALLEHDEAASDRAKANLRKLFDEAVGRGKMARDEAEQQLARLRFLHGGEALPPVDLAIEAIYEDLDAKRALFARLARDLPPETLLATNTSYLDVNAIFAGLAHPERCLGLHFFAPAHLMRLVEVIRASETSAQSLTTAFALTKRLGKIAVEAGVCDGFIGNRILMRYRREADGALLRGAQPADVDAAMADYGMAMGPYAAQDLSGLDIAHANRQRKRRAGLPLSPRETGLPDRMVEELGRLGRKNGRGWFDYVDGAPSPSPEVAALIAQVAQESGIAPLQQGPQGIARRLVLAMIAEGCDIVREGIARRPADIDLVLVHGYGFPRWRGGPMLQADEWGLSQVLDELRDLALADPACWSIPPLLEQLVAEGRSLAELNGTGR